MNKKAFTLIELLVVIAIVGILSGLVFIRMSESISLANDAKRKADIDTIRKALVYYKALSTTGLYPVQSTTCTIGGGATPCTNLTTAIADILPKFPVDPVSGYYTYVSADGSDFTVGTTLSNSTTYSYTASTGFSGPIPLTYASTCAAATNSQVQCTETTDGSYVINKFTYLSSSGTTTWAVPYGVTSIEYLVIGGGGGGATHGNHGAGGGGAGGFRTGTLTGLSGSQSIIVGAGGASMTNGASSTFSSIVSAGGGSGNSDGGSGGGETADLTHIGVGNTPSTSPAQGYNGGDSYLGSNDRQSGGGGGAGGAGNNATSGKGGNGGVGRSSSITGTAIVYAGGGGGSGDTYYAGTPGTGGNGGGGNASGGYPNPGSPGTNGLGGGGGGGSYYNVAGGAGGSGVVIVRYLHP